MSDSAPIGSRPQIIEIMPTKTPESTKLSVRVARPPLDTNLEVLVIKNIGPLRGR